MSVSGSSLLSPPGSGRDIGARIVSWQAPGAPATDLCPDADNAMAALHIGTPAENGDLKLKP